MKDQILQKLMSRKLWVSIIGVVVGIAAAFGINENDYAQVVALIGSIASAIAYVFAESSVDKASAGATLEIGDVTVEGVVDDGSEGN